MNHYRKFFTVLFLTILTVNIFATNISYALGPASSGGQTASDPSLFDQGVEIVTDTVVGWPLAKISEGVLHIISWLLWLSGQALNLVTSYTVVDMKGTMDGFGDTIDKGWTFFRDLGNVVLVFGFLVIGIATILRNTTYGMRNLLAKLIMVAILVNFSLFFTKVIIDGANLFAVSFWNQIAAVTDSHTTKGGDADIGLSNTYMDSLDVATVYGSPNGIYERWSNITTATTNLGGSILLVVTAFVFFAAAIMLMIRFVMLVFLMVMSPLAFVAMALPATAKYAHMWWGSLTKNVLFAPIFFLLTWVVVNIITSPVYPFKCDGSQCTFANLLANNQGAVTMFLNFVFIIGLSVAALVISRQMGIAGSGMVMKWGTNLRKGTQGLIGRNTVGRLADITNKRLNKTTGYLEDQRWGRNLLRGGRVVTLGGTAAAKEKIEDLRKAKFGSSESRADVIDKNKKLVEQGIKDRKSNPQRLATFLTGLSSAQQKEAYEKLSPRDRAAVDLHLTPTLRDQLRLSLGTEDREKTQSAASDAAKAFRSATNRNTIEYYATGTLPAGMPPSTTVPSTSDAQTAIKSLAASETRKLHSRARVNLDIVEQLEPVQLADLLNHGDLTGTERQFIVDALYKTPRPSHDGSPLQKRQKKYMEGDLVKGLWGIA